jgi:ArsR family metal-binding transcriptional regulator
MEEKFFPSLMNEDALLHLSQAYCYPAKGCYKGIVKLDIDLTPLFPYLRAVAKTLYFEPQEQIIFKYQHNGKDYKVSLSKNEVSFALVSDKYEAYEVWKSLKDYLEGVWEKRSEIQPSFKPVHRPTPLEIYKLLPKTNCKECGFLSCLAFASALTTGDAEPAQCPYLDNKTEKFLSETLS